MNTIIERYHDVTARIEAAARKSNRAASDITLVAVSKTYSADDIEPVLQLGHRVFGENRVQESQGKWPALKQDHADISLHLIGPLQTNKVREAVALFDAIETLDREKLARALAKETQSAGKCPELFVQVNTGNEPQKAGIVPEQADAFVKLCTETYGLTVSGMMCIPPFDEDPAPHFTQLAAIADRNGVSKLSMGMSGDFEIAIELGATHVRVGSAIFGARA